MDNPQILNGTLEIRDFGLLEAAAARPAASAFGQDAYLTLNEKAAALFHSLARNHPFTDGNKRTATVAVLFMLRVNGQLLRWQPDEALTMILNVAEGRRDPDSLAKWFRSEPIEPSLEQDAEKDMVTIARIIDEHRGLLDELARR